jgi:6-phosphogluconolactonase
MRRIPTSALAVLAFAGALRADQSLVFLGTGATAIYSVRLDLATGAISAPVVAARSPRPGFLAEAPDGRTLYAGCELPPGLNVRPGAGAVSAFGVERSSGTLRFLNQRASVGGVPPHLVVDATGRMVIAADYSAGSVLAWPVLPDGRLGELSAASRHTGKPGPNRLRQEGPHPHSITLSPDNRFAYACDLGLDRIYAYRLDPGRASFWPATPAFVPVAQGLGPRHAKCSADGRQLYVLNELVGSICVFARNPDGGGLTLQQTIATLPRGFRGPNLCAEIRLDPRGRFVYASNRGADSIVVYSRDPLAGNLTLVQTVGSGGHQPRNFALSPDGRWLLCANRGTNDLTAFRVDPSTGQLTPATRRGGIPQPICVLFLE